MLAATARVPPDTRTVAEELRRKDKLDSVGGIVYLSDLVDWVPTSAHALHYAAIVLSTWTQRRGVELGSAIATLAYATPDADELRTKIQAAVHSHVNSTAGAADMRDLGSVLWELHNEFGATVEPATSTGLLAYDRVTDGGLWPGELVIPASRTGQGKSTFVGTVAANVAAAGKRVDMFSLEMQYQEIARRMLASESGIDSRALRRRELDGESVGRMIDAIGRMEEWPLRLDSARTSIDAIAPKCCAALPSAGRSG